MSMKGSRNCTGAAGKISDHRWPNCLLKIGTKVDKTRGAGNLFQHFTTQTRKGTASWVEDGLVLAGVPS